MASKGHLKRVRRIQRRATPEVIRAFENEQISARHADQLLYLEPDEQRARLGRILAEQADIARRSRLAAEVIRRHVENGSRDLVTLRRDLQLVLGSA